MQRASITRSLRTPWRTFIRSAATTLLAGSVSLALAQPNESGAPSGAPPGNPEQWRESPAHAAIFAPQSRADAYRVFVSPRPLAAMTGNLEAYAGLIQTAGWQPKALLPFEAFGQAGRYDRSKVARLYGSRRAGVVRTPRAQDGAVVESWTLISPYPDPSLTRLEPGTLLIVLRLP